MKESTRVTKSVADAIVSGEYGHVNAKKLLKKKLKEAGISDLRAYEIVENEGGMEKLVREVRERIEEWEERGLPAPVVPGDFKYEYFGTETERYKRVWEDPGWCDDFWPIVEAVEDCDETEFLVVSALWLYCVGNARVFVCDRTGDFGIDLVGIVKDSTQSVFAMTVQAKSSTMTLTPRDALGEYDKFKRSIEEEDAWGKTKDYIGFNEVRCHGGIALGFGILTGGMTSARESARENNFFVRDTHQIAYSVAQRFAASDVEWCLEEWGTGIKEVPEKNWVPVIRSSVES